MHAHWHRMQDMQYALRVLHFSAFHCEGSGEEGVMEDVKRDKYEHRVYGHMNKNRVLTGCC